MERDAKLHLMGTLGKGSLAETKKDLVCSGAAVAYHGRF